MEIVVFITIVSLMLAGLNYYLYRKTRRLVERWRSGRSAARWVMVVRIGFLAMNLPFVALLVLRLAGSGLHQVPQFVLLTVFYPFFAWVGMLVAFAFLGLPAELIGGMVHLGRRLFGKRQASPQPAFALAATAESGTVSRADALPAAGMARRNFLATATAVVPPVLFGISARAVYGFSDLEISDLIKIPVRGLPRAFDGLTITQLSDIHAGAHIRERELQRAVDMANGIGSELVVVTGDIIDSTMDLLPAAQQALSRLRAPLGIYGVVGNHDYYADSRRTADGYPGCVRIIEGMRAAGVRILRNERASVRLHGEELLLLGLDWTGVARGNPNLYFGQLTRNALRRTLDGYEGDATRILLAHHPHVFFEAAEFNIAMTFAGHTHGGGQIVIAEHNGRPIALGSAVFRYLSGLYREGHNYLYVNRGVGVVGLPIRIKCPPEISRFQLVRA